MQPFTQLKAIAAPMPMINVDTDIIIPKQFLRTIERTGLGKNAFNDIRYNDDGSEKEDFVLNQEPYRKAQILVTGDNFGCGSSREHAPWALLDLGLRCIIAPSFADIFYNNCFKNGILPVIMDDKEAHAGLMKWIQENENPEVKIDLETQLVTWGNQSYEFEVDEFRKHCLLNGLDDIGLTLKKETDINAYEQQIQKDRPWL